MASVFVENPAASDSGNQDIGALFDVWAAMAVREVLEPDLDDILQSHLETLYRGLQRLSATDDRGARGPVS